MIRGIGRKPHEDCRIDHASVIVIMRPCRRRGVSKGWTFYFLEGIVLAGEVGSASIDALMGRENRRWADNHCHCQVTSEGEIVGRAQRRSCLFAFPAITITSNLVFITSTPGSSTPFDSPSEGSAMGENSVHMQEGSREERDERTSLLAAFRNLNSR